MTKLVAFAKKKDIDLVIVGMDDPLVGGLVDALEAEGIRSIRTKKECSNSGRFKSIFQGSDEEISTFQRLLMRILQIRIRHLII